MQVPSDNREQWLKRTFIPFLIDNGTLHIHQKLAKIEVTVPDLTNTFMASTLYFVQISYGSETLNVVVKLVPKIRVEFLHLEEQFFNEITIYTKILPEIGAQHLFPKFYYGIIEGKNSIIVLEDLRESGFKMSESSLKISQEHIELALETLGCFHGLCYRHKEMFPGKLKELCGSLIDMRGARDKEVSFYEDYNEFIKKCIKRGIDYLKEHDQEINENILDEIESKFEYPHKILNDVTKPMEPLSILVHGDFNRNNMMFKYDDNGNPAEIRLFDLQLASYSSPSVDISFLLYMNGDSKVRDDNLSHCLYKYHNSLINTIDNKFCSEKYSFERFQDNYNATNWFGFVIAIFFFPMMYDPAKTLKITNDATTGVIDQLEGDRLMLQVGGVEADRNCGELVKSIYKQIVNNVV